MVVFLFTMSWNYHRSTGHRVETREETRSYMMYVIFGILCGVVISLCLLLIITSIPPNGTSPIERRLG